MDEILTMTPDVGGVFTNLVYNGFPENIKGINLYASRNDVCIYHVLTNKVDEEEYINKFSFVNQYFFYVTNIDEGMFEAIHHACNVGHYSALFIKHRSKFNVDESSILGLVELCNTYDILYLNPNNFADYFFMNRKAIERACLIEIDFTVGDWYKRYCAELGKKLRIGKSKDAVVEKVDYDMSLVVDEHNNIVTEEKVVRDSGMIQTESVTAEETVKDLGVIEQPMPQMVYQQPPMQYAYQAPTPQHDEFSVAKEADGVLVCCFLEDDINKHKDFIERCFEIGVAKVIFYISNTDLNITKAIHAYMKDNFISFEFRAPELSREEVFSKAYEKYCSTYEWIAFLDVDDILSLDDKYENIDLLLEDKRYNKYDCIKVFKQGDEPIFKNFVRTSNIYSIKFADDGSIEDISTCGSNGKKVYKYISKQKNTYDNIYIL